VITYTEEALEYLARMSEGGMRDAITLLDKCISYSEDVTVENIVKALGTVDYKLFFELTDAVQDRAPANLIKVLEGVHADGKDLKQFLKDYMNFLLDVVKYDITGKFEYMQMPSTYKDTLEGIKKKCPDWFGTCQRLLDVVVKLNSAVKYDTQPKVLIEATLVGAIDR